MAALCARGGAAAQCREKARQAQDERSSHLSCDDQGPGNCQVLPGQVLCANLERYSDYENRLPRGRTYVRDGSVVDLQIAKSKVLAVVSGSDLYRVTII